MMDSSGGVPPWRGVAANVGLRTLWGIPPQYDVPPRMSGHMAWHFLLGHPLATGIPDTSLARPGRKKGERGLTTQMHRNTFTHR